ELLGDRDGAERAVEIDVVEQRVERALWHPALRGDEEGLFHEPAERDGDLDAARRAAVTARVDDDAAVGELPRLRPGGHARALALDDRVARRLVHDRAVRRPGARPPDAMELPEEQEAPEEVHPRITIGASGALRSGSSRTWGAPSARPADR